MKDKKQKEKKIKKNKKGGSNIKKPFVATFQINNDSIIKFRRWVKKPKDCVKFNWKLFDDATGKKLGDIGYKFCKGRAMTNLKIRKIKSN